MADHNNTHNSHGGERHEHGSVKSYVIGYIISIILTIIPLVVVMNDMMGRTATIAVIMVTATLQFLVQLVFFMHIRDGEQPRWNAITLVFGILILLTIVIGSIWIMGNNQIGMRM
ncbi:cytochrome o ubiquinol oxidase subunit IV [Saccharibacillus alkalitolerans]|uniref:Cytochrome o ubiquinol oxidase subunit IV n=1 Tax=Saccharibacillus alkalitolerans TaxID=2705290 RepID=A0ABX0FA82_9BACL|nr:cytochrome o ubiquinol oxidase subunit IV [Saccharibacillus alkalitolerans]NGZ77842.1 cytochrome o ubiquinol oxidase subunit IV [Saccharibacillus alkalitolerans]